jgi:transcriptional antiterminator RfaH
MNVFHTGWYLIYTKPRQEKKVHGQLTEMNINSLLPTRKSLRTWHDRKKYIEEPLFPSYVFIYLNDRQKYYEGMETEGALYYVRSGKEITRVRESVIDNIMLLTGAAMDLEVSNSHFQPGRRLVISQGALTGLSCEVVQYNNMQKILVRVDLLQRNLLLTVPEEYLMAV